MGERLRHSCSQGGDVVPGHIQVLQAGDGGQGMHGVDQVVGHVQPCQHLQDIQALSWNTC